MEPEEYPATSQARLKLPHYQKEHLKKFFAVHLALFYEFAGVINSYFLRKTYKTQWCKDFITAMSILFTAGLHKYIMVANF